MLLPVNLPAAIFRQPGLTLQLGLTHEYYWYPGRTGGWRHWSGFGGRFTQVNSLLGALLFGAFVGFHASVRTQPGKAVVTAGFLTKFIF